MLIYHCDPNETLVINDDIHLSFSALASGVICITIRAPESTQVDKGAIYARFQGHSNRSKQNAPKSYDQYGQYR